MDTLVSVPMKPLMTDTNTEPSALGIEVSGALVFSTESSALEVNCFGKEIEVYINELQRGTFLSFLIGKSPVRFIRQISMELNKHNLLCSVFYEGEKLLIVGAYSNNKLTKGVLGNYVRVTNIRELIRLMRFLKWF